MVVTKESIAAGVHLLTELLVFNAFNKNEIITNSRFFKSSFLELYFITVKKAIFQLKIYQSPCLPNRTVTSMEYR